MVCRRFGMVNEITAAVTHVSQWQRTRQRQVIPEQHRGIRSPTGTEWRRQALVIIRKGNTRQWGQAPATTFERRTGTGIVTLRQWYMVHGWARTTGPVDRWHALKRVVRIGIVNN